MGPLMPSVGHSPIFQLKFLIFFLFLYKIMLLVFIRVDLPGVLVNRGIRPFISGEQGNNSLKLKGTGEQRQFWGTGNIEN